MKNAVIKAVAATLAIAAAGTASAATIPTNGIFFSAWNGDSNAPSSIVINLNITSDDFLANPSAGYTLNATDAGALASWLGSVNSANVEWGVFGAMRGAQDSATYGPLLTSPGINNPNGPDPLNDNPNWGTFQGLETNQQGFDIFLTNPTNGPSHLNGSTNVYSASDTASLFWPTYSGNIGVDGLASVNTSMAFYGLFADQAVGGDPFFTGDGIQYGNWTLSYVSGLASLVYAAAGGGPEVPLPGAVWLLGSGLLGLASIRRRKNAAAATAAA